MKFLKEKCANRVIGWPDHKADELACSAAEGRAASESHTGLTTPASSVDLQHTTTVSATTKHDKQPNYKAPRDNTLHRAGGGESGIYENPLTQHRPIRGDGLPEGDQLADTDLKNRTQRDEPQPGASPDVNTSALRAQAGEYVPLAHRAVNRRNTADNSRASEPTSMNNAAQQVNELTQSIQTIDNPEYKTLHSIDSQRSQQGSQVYF